MEHRHIGILGGGQLARMMALAGLPLGFRFVFLDPAADACAAELGTLLVASFDDREAVARLSQQVDLATYDFENVPESSAQILADVLSFSPGTRALGLCQDRITEKELLNSVGIPLPAYCAVEGRTSLLDGVDALGWPAVLKTRRLGYDGKGQQILRQTEDLERGWQKLGGQSLILEAFVPFEAECSIIGLRDQDGHCQFWPLTRNVHSNGILLASRPGVFDADLQDQAEVHLRRLADHLDYVGVLTIEFFLNGGNLLANEIAPRVHNSGHWTIDGAATSQFENHIRVIAGLAPGETTQKNHCLMLNCIGAMPHIDAGLTVPGVHWHDYGKAPRPGRKVGHLTLTAHSSEELLRRAERLRPHLPQKTAAALEAVLGDFC